MVVRIKMLMAIAKRVIAIEISPASSSMFLRCLAVDDFFANAQYLIQTEYHAGVNDYGSPDKRSVMVINTLYEQYALNKENCNWKNNGDIRRAFLGMH